MTPEQKAKFEQEMNARPSDIWPTNKDEKGDYYYNVSICSFPGYYSEDAGSYFIAGDERPSFMVMENGVWPQETSAVMNNDHHPIPTSLFVRWFSLAENKFYAGTFEMPAETIKKYLDEMWIRYKQHTFQYERDKHERFQHLIVGVAPKGEVFVWISDGGSRQIEIGNFQAKETRMDWDDFASLSGSHGEGYTRAYYLNAFHKEASMPIPYGKAQEYREKFIWRPRIQYVHLEPNDKVQKETLRYGLELYNGETESLYHEFYNENNFKERAVPKKINFQWRINQNEQYAAEVNFDEKDIYKAYHSICTDKNTQAELVLKIDRTNKIWTLVLRSKTHEYVMDSYKAGIWKPKYDSKRQVLKDE
ncbi:DUF2931 family protein [uncultured Flavobacterium sp.]|uniref:DUF2931 family protein n=1 Tax=uncultured Flavobacterium sp. TaxID=165435 RepID=UPI0025FF4392|nr:DUF2931 family protein [uncultured Flavobacterium sp.]